MNGETLFFIKIMIKFYLCNINKCVRVTMTVLEWKSPVAINHISILLIIISSVPISRIVSEKNVNKNMLIEIIAEWNGRN